MTFQTAVHKSGACHSFAKLNPNAFSARVLAEKVLVPLSAELGFSYGVTSRQPLSNQPYFRMTRLGDNTPIQRGSRPAFDYCETGTRKALRAFIAVAAMARRTNLTGSEG